MHSSGSGLKILLLKKLELRKLAKASDRNARAIAAEVLATLPEGLLPALSLEQAVNIVYGTRKSVGSGRQRRRIPADDDKSANDKWRPMPVSFTISVDDWIDEGKRNKKLTFEGQIFVFDCAGKLPGSSYYVCHYYKKLHGGKW